MLVLDRLSATMALDTEAEPLEACAGEQDRVEAAFLEPAQPIHDEKAVPRDPAAVGDIGRKADVEQDQIGLFPAHE